MDGFPGRILSFLSGCGSWEADLLSGLGAGRKVELDLGGVRGRS